MVTMHVSMWPSAGRATAGDSCIQARRILACALLPVLLAVFLLYALFHTTPWVRDQRVSFVWLPLYGWHQSTNRLR